MCARINTYEESRYSARTRWGSLDVIKDVESSLRREKFIASARRSSRGLRVFGTHTYIHMQPNLYARSGAVPISGKFKSLPEPRGYNIDYQLLYAKS